MRKPGKKHNQIDVRLQCNTPKKKLFHSVKNEVLLLLAEYFQFWHSKVHENLPSHYAFFLSLFENMQLTNHFHLNFTFLNLYLKDTLLRPTCRASTLWRDLIRMFKRSLEKSEKPPTCRNNEKPAEFQWNKENPTPPSGTSTDQRPSSGTPKRNPNGTH